MQIKIKSVQIIDGKKEEINQIGTGSIEEYEKGSILSWSIPEEPLQYQMTILENKILIKNQNQKMIFELGKTTKGELQAGYGKLSISITTNHMEIKKENTHIKNIFLDYEISIQETTNYENKIEITIQ